MIKMVALVRGTYCR